MSTNMGELGVEDSKGNVWVEEEHLGLFSGWKSCPPPDPEAISDVCLSAAEEAAEQVLNCIHPTLDSEEKRRDVIDYVQQLVKSHLDCEVVSYGSVPLKTYLPDGDIDLTVLKGPNAEESLAHDVLALFQDEEQNEYADYEVTDTQFIDAEVASIQILRNSSVKLVKCLVRNIVVDISFNQLGGLSTLCFLEQVDRLVGRNHLFKRSIILVKTWCYYESRILGAHHGLISTYALETLVLYIFHFFHSSLTGPLAVLYRFLAYFSQFDWENYCVSLEGPVCKSSLPDVVVKMPESGWKDRLLSEEFLENCMDMFSVPCRGLEANQKAFQTKHINIIDPLKENNNLGRSVHRGNFYRIRSAFKYGARKLGQVLSQPSDKVADEICKFFMNTRARHEHQYRNSIRRLALDFGDEESLIVSLPSPVESFSDDDEMLLLKSYISDIDNDSVCAEQTDISDFKNELDRYSIRENNGGKNVLKTSDVAFDCISSSNCSASLTDNHFHKLHYSSSAENGSSESNHIDGTNSWLDNRENHVEMNSILDNPSLDFREVDTASVGGESEPFNPLADLTGDYDSHVRSLLRGQLCHVCALSANLLRNNPPLSLPSGIQNKKTWDIVRQSMPLRQNKISEMSPHTISMDHTMSVGADSAFGFEGQQKSRGTGTYFPNMNIIYVERPSNGRSWNKAQDNQNLHFHAYGHSNGLYSVYGSHDAVPARSRYQGRKKRSDIQCSSPHAVGVGGHRINGYLSASCRIEFGSIGNLAEEVISGSAHVRGSIQGASLNTQGSMTTMMQERVAGQSIVIHLKNEDEFPPLCQ